MPETEEEWKELSDQMFSTWQYPNSIGAMDGKHIGIFNPADSVSMFYNYKSFYSIVLLGLVDHRYQFIYANIACQGRINDSGVFKNSDLYQNFENGSLNIPNPAPFPRTGNPIWDEDDYPDIPYNIVGDDAFQLSIFLMKPYSKKYLDDESRVFNYRLSRFRRVSENCFGILCSRFRLFLGRLNLSLENIITIVLAGCVLHNMLCEKSRASYMPGTYIDHEDPVTKELIEGDWRNDVPANFTQNNIPCKSLGPRSAEK